jgi:hypothetical protein
MFIKCTRYDAKNKNKKWHMNAKKNLFYLVCVEPNLLPRNVTGA